LGKWWGERDSLVESLPLWWGSAFLGKAVGIDRKKIPLFGDNIDSPFWKEFLGI
jgi:hypothetical protein